MLKCVVFDILTDVHNEWKNFVAILKLDNACSHTGFYIYIYINLKKFHFELKFIYKIYVNVFTYNELNINVESRQGLNG